MQQYVLNNFQIFFLMKSPFYIWRHHSLKSYLKKNIFPQKNIFLKMFLFFYLVQKK